MECYSFTKPGRLHLKNGEKNQDQLFGIRSSDRIAICLSDGCSTASHGLAAAQQIVTLTARMFYDQFYELLLDDPDTVRRKICAVLQPALRAFAEQQSVEPEALAATLIVFAADDTGRYLCAHLGDGCILMQPRGRRACRIFNDLCPFLRNRAAFHLSDHEHQHDAAPESISFSPACAGKIPSAYRWRRGPAAQQTSARPASLSLFRPGAGVLSGRTAPP